MRLREQEGEAPQLNTEEIPELEELNKRIKETNETARKLGKFIYLFITASMQHENIIFLRKCYYTYLFNVVSLFLIWLIWVDLGEEGKVEESMEAMKQAEQLRQQKAKIQATKMVEMQKVNQTSSYIVQQVHTLLNSNDLNFKKKNF